MIYPRGIFKSKLSLHYLFRKPLLIPIGCGGYVFMSDYFMSEATMMGIDSFFKYNSRLIDLSCNKIIKLIPTQDFSEEELEQFTETAFNDFVEETNLLFYEENILRALYLSTPSFSKEVVCDSIWTT